MLTKLLALMQSHGTPPSSSLPAQVPNEQSAIRHFFNMLSLDRIHLPVEHVETAVWCAVDPPEGTKCILQPYTVKLGSIAKVLAECKLKYYRISECRMLGKQCSKR